MANVLFTRTSDPNSKPITDGQLIFDTSGNGKMYLDNGTERLEMGGALTVDATLSKTSTNPIQNKAVAGVMLDNLSDINNVTSKGFLADALAIKELNSSLSKLEEGQDYSKEIIIGKWVDGKPVYRKMVKTPMTDFVESSTYKTINISHNIENIEKVVNAFSIGAMHDTGIIQPLPYFENGVCVTNFTMADKTKIVFSNKIAWGSRFEVGFILDYTKVTD